MFWYNLEKLVSNRPVFCKNVPDPTCSLNSFHTKTFDTELSKNCENVILVTFSYETVITKPIFELLLTCNRWIAGF